MISVSLTDLFVDLPVIIGQLRDKLRAKPTLSGASRVCTFQGKFVLIYVGRDGSVELQRSAEEPRFKAMAERITYEKELERAIEPLTSFLSQHNLNIGPVV